MYYKLMGHGVCNRSEGDKEKQGFRPKSPKIQDRVKPGQNPCPMFAPYDHLGWNSMYNIRLQHELGFKPYIAKVFGLWAFKVSLHVSQPTSKHSSTSQDSHSQELEF